MATSGTDSSGATGREIWILRSDERQRATLLRLSGVTGEHVRTGSPSDAEFRATGDRPRVALVILGVSGDPEVELEYVHRNARRLANADWIIVSDDRSDAELAALFDALDATFIGPPVQAARLRGAIGRALATPEARDSLRLRGYRDALSERFARWFGDLDLPELLRAMDPQLARVPMIVRGEPGTGRALLARYVHTFGGDAAGGQMPFVEILCSDSTSTTDLLRAIETSAGARNATLFLKDLEELQPQVEVELRNWIEFGLPPGTRCASQIRWVGALPVRDAPPNVLTAHLDPDLLAVFSGLEVRLPPLRARRAAIEPFARATALAQTGTNGRRARDFSADAIEALQHHDWPGNLRELESVIRRALADSGADPLEARHLRLTASRGTDSEQLAESWHADDRADEALPEAEILEDIPERLPDGDGDVRRDADAEPVIELLADDETGDYEGGEYATDEDEDEEGFEEEGEEARVEWIDVDEDNLSIDWIEGEPLGADESAGGAGADDLAKLPSIEVRPLPRGTAPRGGFVKGEPAPGLASTSEASLAPADATPPPADFHAWDRSLSAICDELQRPVEEMRSLAIVLAAHEIAPDFIDSFANRISHNIDRCHDASERLAALQPSVETSTDASLLLESLLAELRGEISRRGLLVLKELDRARPHALAHPSSLRFALRSLLARFVARNRAASSSDLYIASHHHPSGLSGRPSLRILIRHAAAPGASFAPSPDGEARGERDLSIELAICDAVARWAGGALSISEPDSGQIVVVIDLPAPD